jgi:hypothetical protein
MDKIITYAKVRAGDEILHDGKLSLVRMISHGPRFAFMTLDSGIITAENSAVAAVRRPVKTRTGPPPCPPLTARLNPEERAWVISTAESLGCKPQALIAVAVEQYKASSEAVPAASILEHKPRRWSWRRRRAA